MVQNLAQDTLSFTNRIIGNTAFMLLDKGIGPDKARPSDLFIDGSNFSEEMYFHKSQGKNITVKINTPGGRVDHGWSMVDAILETGADTFAAGLAYSMGGICLMFGKYRKAYSHSSIMIHSPRGASTTYLDVVKNQFRTLLESRTKFSKAEIDEMMDSGKDYFFTAKEALSKGIIDEIVYTDIQTPANASTNDLYLFYNNHIENTNETNMNIFGKPLFGKDTEVENVEAAFKMKAENEVLKAEKLVKESEIESLKAKVNELENSGKVSSEKTKATDLIKGAISSKKIAPNAEDEAKLIENATANYDAVKMLIDALPSKKNVAVASVIDASAKKENMTYEHLAKHAPDQLQALAENDPELLNKLMDDYMKTQNEKK